ncbi:YqgE/AlgH family protein [Sulfitobacter sp. HNIBRBA3233]|uniref:YqgE/AlgH family protein n=1 Tax=Sulfitobacter marinivivus TaxID=3158558 RepID=UPI0032DFA0EA
MTDPRFMRSVVLVCSHDSDGAMGLTLNKPVTGMRFSEVLDRLDIAGRKEHTGGTIHIGGPVETERGFFLHDSDFPDVIEPLVIPGGFALTATQDILERIAQGKGPDRYLFALGYAGWGAGQLEGEIAENGWLTATPTQDLVFATSNDRKWDAALASIGIDPVSLSGAAGRA